MRLTPEVMLRAYASGLFPMAEDADSDELLWFDPDPRAILSVDRLHIPKRLRRILRQQPYVIRIDTAFAEMIERCGPARPDGARTWINAEITELFIELHRMGYAHSVEAWHGDDLVGGLYGVALGGAFFGESMFSAADNASKIALVHLAARLKAGGFTLLDTQFVNDHLLQFGVTEISRRDYHKRLHAALQVSADFYLAGAAGGGVAGLVDEAVLVDSFLQSTSQIS